MMTEALEKMRAWFNQHGSSRYRDADEWINQMSNVELLETLSWILEDD